VRVSDGMREETVATLRRRFAEGYLSPATLEERVDRALRAKTHEALALTLADLPPDEPAWRRLLRRTAPVATLAPDRVAILDLSFHVGAGPVLVGRDPDCAIVLADETVSRRHAELDLAGDLCRVRDVGSTNGTFVRGRAITTARLREGDEVTFGLLTLRLRWSR
jgi:hypothetical protein